MKTADICETPIVDALSEDYYSFRDRIPKGYAMSTAADELAMVIDIAKHGSLKDSEKFRVLFERQLFLMTDTGLRIPQGWGSGRYEIKKGGKFYPYIVLKGGKEVAEILLPEGRGRVVPYNGNPEEVFYDCGLPRVTVNPDRYSRHLVHFCLCPDSGIDGVSGHRDMAVAIRARRKKSAYSGNCLVISAGYRRDKIHPRAVFRLVPAQAGKIVYARAA